MMCEFCDAVSEVFLSNAHRKASPYAASCRACSIAAAAAMMSSVECFSETHKRRLGWFACGAPIRSQNAPSASQSPGEHTCTAKPEECLQASATACKRSLASVVPDHCKCCT